MKNNVPQGDRIIITKKKQYQKTEEPLKTLTEKQYFSIDETIKNN